MTFNNINNSGGQPNCQLNCIYILPHILIIKNHKPFCDNLKIQFELRKKQVL